MLTFNVKKFISITWLVLHEGKRPIQSVALSLVKHRIEYAVQKYFFTPKNIFLIIFLYENE